MAIAAELPDIDTLWSLRGPISGFEHHRGITHTFLGLPFEAAALLCIFVLIHRIRTDRARAVSTYPPAPRVTAPVRWGVLYECLLLALLSHLLLDYTNNYGVRPFFPFDAHWYAASIVFIFDPLLFVLLVGGLLLPSLFALIAREVGGKRESFRGAGWARAALLGVVTLWCFRWHEHANAVARAQAEPMQAPATDADLVNSTPDLSGSGSEVAPQEKRPVLFPERVLAGPDPLSPFRWYTVADYGPSYLLGTANTKLGTLEPGQVLHKPALTNSVLMAENTRLGRVYLDWSSMPWISSDLSAGNISSGQIAVVFEDLRFKSGMSFLHREGKPPLAGQVVLSSSGEVLDQSMDGRSER